MWYGAAAPHVVCDCMKWPIAERSHRSRGKGGERSTNIAWHGNAWPFVRSARRNLQCPTSRTADQLPSPNWVRNTYLPISEIISD